MKINACLLPLKLIIIINLLATDRKDP